MSVITRSRDKQIAIGNGDIIVTVLDIREDKVRLGIDAPDAFPIHRQEDYNAMKNGEFRDLLESHKYRKAYDFLLKNPAYKFPKDDFLQLKKGLEGLEELNDQTLKNLKRRIVRC